MKYQNNFGSAFRLVRLARRRTQEDFAQHSGRTYVSEVERDVKHPTLQKIDELVVPLSLHPVTVIVLAYLSQRNLQACDELWEIIREELSSVIE